MKRMWMLGVGVGALLVAAGCAGTSEAKRDVEGAIPGVESTREGMVVEVRQDSIAVQDAENPDAPPVRFQRTEETDLVRNDQPFSWPELSEGMPVRVHYDEATGAEQATRIEILTGAEADEVRSKARGSTGWSRPDRSNGVGAPPPADMPDDSMESGDEPAWGTPR